MTVCKVYDHAHNIFKVPLRCTSENCPLVTLVHLHNNMTNKLLSVASKVVQALDLTSKKLCLEEVHSTT